MNDGKGKDPYEIPRKRDAFKMVDSTTTITTADIVARIISNKYVSLFSLFYD